jgi:hypothetical protein
METNLSTPNLAITGKAAQILKLLGDGHPNAVVASAVGVTESYVSQLLADENFVLEVSKLRLAKLAKHSEQDELYDDLEFKLAKKLNGLLDYVMDPMKVMKMLAEMNKLKRRNHSTSEGIAGQATVIQLQLPQAIRQKLEVKVNINNQVLQIGEQSMTTATIGALNNLVKDMRHKQALTLENQSGQITNPARSNGA